jgi:hypothetical protein
MSSYPATVKPPESLAEALTPLASLSDAEFSKLAAAVSGTRSFSLSRDQLDALKKEVPAAAAILAFTLGTLAFLSSQVDDVAEGDSPISDIVSQLVDDLDKEGKWAQIKPVMKARLTELLAKKPNHRRFKKIQRLQTGFVPNATGFSSFLDLRPDFNEGKPEQINGLLPVIQFRISTDADNPAMRRLVVQLDEESVAELKKAVDRIVEKMQVLKQNTTLTSYLVKL